jgi:hypothetical protein
MRTNKQGFKFLFVCSLVVEILGEEKKKRFQTGFFFLIFRIKQKNGFFFESPSKRDNNRTTTAKQRKNNSIEHKNFPFSDENTQNVAGTRRKMVNENK